MALLARSAQASSAPSRLPTSRSASRWRCSGVRFATSSARASSFAVSSVSVQRVVQRDEGLDVTSYRLSLAIDELLTPNLDVAGPSPGGHTCDMRILGEAVSRCAENSGQNPGQFMHFYAAQWPASFMSFNVRNDCGTSDRQKKIKGPRYSSNPAAYWTRAVRIVFRSDKSYKHTLWPLRGYKR